MTVQLGTILDRRYVLLQELGKGGMGVVYKAKHLQFDKFVAIKVLPISIVSDRTSLFRFHQEAKLLASLDHKNIVAAQAFGTSDSGVPYIVMEYVDGISLTKLGQLIANEDRMDTGLQLFIQICDALKFIHDKGIIHRDVKPDNIIMTGDQSGEMCAKLIDFGTGRLTFSQDRQKLTTTGLVVGSPPYMGPEGWSGGTPDHRIDIYALGCAMFEYFTGERFVQSDTLPEIVAAHLAVDPRETLQSSQNLVEFEQLRMVIARAMQKLPENRYQSAEDVAFDLQQIRQGEKVATSTHLATTPKAKVTRTRKRLATFLAATLVSGTIAGSIVVYNQLSKKHVSAEQQEFEILMEKILSVSTALNFKDKDEDLYKKILDLTTEYLATAERCPRDWVSQDKILLAKWQQARSLKHLKDDQATLDVYRNIYQEVRQLALDGTVKSLFSRSSVLEQIKNTEIQPFQVRTVCLEYAAACLRCKKELDAAVGACKFAQNYEKDTEPAISSEGKSNRRKNEFREWTNALIILLYRANGKEKEAAAARDEFIAQLQQTYKSTSKEAASKAADEIIDECKMKVGGRRGVWWWSPTR